MCVKIYIHLTPNPMNLQFKFTAVFVSDVEKVRDFYVNTLGLKVAADKPETHSLYFETGDTTLGLHVPSEKNRHKAQIGRSTGVVFLVPNVREAVQELESKGVTVTPTYSDNPDRPDQAVFSDPDGNEFGLADKTPW
jgi:catechol 2,3-dioxygenase-like lactoylglutathione lyase family enzyme